LRPPSPKTTTHNLSFDGDLNAIDDAVLEPKQKGITDLDFRPFCRFESRESTIEIAGKKENYILHRHFFTLLGFSARDVQVSAYNLRAELMAEVKGLLKQVVSECRVECVEVKLLQSSSERAKSYESPTDIHFELQAEKQLSEIPLAGIFNGGDAPPSGDPSDTLDLASFARQHEPIHLEDLDSVERKPQTPRPKKKKKKSRAKPESIWKSFRDFYRADQSLFLVEHV